MSDTATTPNEEGRVLRFPRMPRRYIASLTAQCPALGLVAGKLGDLREELRPDGECILGELFVRLLHLPRLTVDEAETVLSHEGDPDLFVNDELTHLEAHRGPLHDMWRWIWEREDDPDLRAWARYAAALLARLYRFEFRALNERAAFAAQAPA